ncbi:MULTISPECIES: multidrug efflux SMR transporter [unclassified Saccharopolyspora]|uniref:DMT family transporter n=1 Tax=unclassified Saccharopolyspora TaxID=2646250 RepID=UPI001CD58CC3|nr:MULTISPECIES: multidrug efflux SMR transporter [unclassified Saccharopolyspora]MCA1188187.1 multidrug efflux SMR transporter [Saccharopolyspora sp. 6T]MCA1196306.1 multidrug efflux SMR transporter [Saccharopolyspora sp. 6V]MCA1227917.1 multidrug efflux SMR transporter [Saccharopolyspora sp. 6M]MCA1281206.1 multidrug efflux SMR transporter [Saccharopolyspora sp. 7B]
MSAARRAWAHLAGTIVLEIVATLALRASAGFTAPVPSAVAVVGYGATVVLLSRALRVIPLGVAYVIWTGAGTAGVALLGSVLFADHLPPVAWLGVACVIGGVAMINLARRDSREERGAAEEHPE